MNYKYAVSYYQGFKKKNRDLSAHSRKSNEKLFLNLASTLPALYTTCKERAARTSSALQAYAWGDFNAMRTALNQFLWVMEDLYGEETIDPEFYSFMYASYTDE